MIKLGFNYFFTMEPIDYFFKYLASTEATDYLSKPQEIDINKLSKDNLQEVCEEISTQINKYDYYIRRQLEDTIKNYNLCIALCKEKLDLVSSYREYKTVLATLSAGKKDLSTTNNKNTQIDPVELMKSFIA